MPIVKPQTHLVFGSVAEALVFCLSVHTAAMELDWWVMMHALNTAGVIA